MFIEKAVETDSLFLAAVLMACGGRIAGIDVSGRLGKITIDTRRASMELLSSELMNLIESLRDSGDTTNLDDFTFAIDSSLLGTIEGNYHRLKKLVINARKKSK